MYRKEPLKMTPGGSYLLSPRGFSLDLPGSQVKGVFFQMTVTETSHRIWKTSAFYPHTRSGEPATVFNWSWQQGETPDAQKLLNPLQESVVLLLKKEHFGWW